jgi:hypothetical protein
LGGVIFGGVQGALGVEDGEEVLQAAGVAVCREGQGAAVGGDGGAQGVEALAFAGSGDQGVFYLLDGDQGIRAACSYCRNDCS